MRSVDVHTSIMFYGNQDLIYHLRKGDSHYDCFLSLHVCMFIIRRTLRACLVRWNEIIKEWNMNNIMDLAK